MKANYTYGEMKRAFECGRIYQLTGENNFRELIEDLYKDVEQKEKKPTKEEFIANIVNNLTVRKEQGSYSTFYDYDGHTVFEHDPEYSDLWVSWIHVWSILSNEYSMQYIDVQEFVKCNVVEPLNLVDVTPRCFALLLKGGLLNP